MIQQLSQSINSFLFGNHSPSLDSHTLMQKIKRVATCIFLGFLYTALYYLTPNLCYIGFLFGMCLGEKVHLRDLAIKVKKTWAQLKLHERLLLFPAAYFIMPIGFATTSFTAFATLGDHLVRSATRKPTCTSI